MPIIQFVYPILLLKNVGAVRWDLYIEILSRVTTFLFQGLTCTRVSVSRLKLKLCLDILSNELNNICTQARFCFLET